MLKTDEAIRRLAALTSVVLWATAEALAQENAGGTARKIVVSIPDRKLAVVEGEQVVKIFSTAVGAERTPSPTGTFQIVQRVSDPTWYSKGKVVGPGRTNPVGTRWIGLSMKGYGIHGTNNPASIGHNASHGCIRMRNRDVEELFTMVAVGDTVELHGERTPELDQIFGASVEQAGAVAGQ
jgi:lipoprotein-anchoring transpeptidase ErfK/SrfK